MREWIAGNIKGCREFVGATICEVIRCSQAPLSSPSVQWAQKLWHDPSWGFSQWLGSVGNGDNGARELGLQGTGWRGRSWNLSWLRKIGSSGTDSCSDFLIDSVTLGKLPHISGLQFLPTCKWGCWLIWLTLLPVLKFCGSILQKMQALFDYEWETLPTPNHWGQATCTMLEKQIPLIFLDHWCNSLIFSWKYEKCSGPFP